VATVRFRPQNDCEISMNGADSLVHTLLQSGVNRCFANPGTSEMHFVAAPAMAGCFAVSGKSAGSKECVVADAVDVEPVSAS